jgi:hypothetical protein
MPAMVTNETSRTWKFGKDQFLYPHIPVEADDALVKFVEQMNRLGISQFKVEPIASPPPPESTESPVNVDIPHVSQNGNTLNCTMGNWEGEPTGYEYQWQIEGVDAGGNTDNYIVQPSDVGKSAVCIVTATNANGSTDAPPSSDIVIIDTEVSRRVPRR